jgi:small-conductance mechanosensitive channel
MVASYEISEEFKHWLFHETSGMLLFSLACVVILWLTLRFVKAVISRGVKDSDRRYRSRKLLDFTGYAFTLLIVAVIFSSKMKNVTVALGIAGAGIAFALQEVITSIAGWIAIMFGGFYKTGDRVQLGGIKGDVIDIGVLRTTLMEMGQWVDGDLYNGRVVLVANSSVFKDPVFNYSADFEFLWDEIKVPINYGSNYKKAKELFLSLANEICGDNAKQAQQMWGHVVRKYLIENASTEAMVTLTANSNWVEFTIRYTVGYQKRRITKDKLFSRILEEVEKTDGEIQFASSLIQMVDTSGISTPLKEEKKASQ